MLNWTFCMGIVNYCRTISNLWSISDLIHSECPFLGQEYYLVRLIHLSSVNSRQMSKQNDKTLYYYIFFRKTYFTWMCYTDLISFGNAGSLKRQPKSILQFVKYKIGSITFSIRERFRLNLKYVVDSQAGSSPEELIRKELPSTTMFLMNLLPMVCNVFSNLSFFLW